MKTKTFNFSLGSRQLFPEEQPVIQAVQAAVQAAAVKHGLSVQPGSAIAKVITQLKATPSLKRGHHGGGEGGGIAKAMDHAGQVQARSGKAVAEGKIPPTTVPKSGAIRSRTY